MVQAAAASAKAAATTKEEPLTFDYTDALNLECRLTEEEKMVRNVFHDYCQVCTTICTTMHHYSVLQNSAADPVHFRLDWM